MSNILMSHKNDFYSVTINEFLMVKKQVATLKFSALRASYRSTNLNRKLSKKLYLRLSYLLMNLLIATN